MVCLPPPSTLGALQEESSEGMATNLIYKLEKQQHFLIFTVFVITVTAITGTHTR